MSGAVKESIFSERGSERGKIRHSKKKRGREDSERRGRCWRDVKLRHGSPGLATGDCYPQGDLGNTHKKREWWQ